MRTVEHVINGLIRPDCPELPRPTYSRNHHSGTTRIALTVPSMQRHMSDEGWQVMQALQHDGYQLIGGQCNTDVERIVNECNPGIVVMQDKREWDSTDPANNLANREEHFYNLHALADRCDIFKLTILKDSHQRPFYHRASANEIGCHGWIIYYHPTIVKHMAPYVRLQHCVRTYHTINRRLIPLYYAADRRGCLLSGAVSGVYPIRSALVNNLERLPDCRYLAHPGYHNQHCHTPEFLEWLSTFKVAICTSSILGYSLRKIIEATACGCRVITDLPVDDVLPQIDGNLVRLESKNSERAVEEVIQLLPILYDEYDPEIQLEYATAAMQWYDYRVMGIRLASQIEELRQNYREL